MKTLRSLLLVSFLSIISSSFASNISGRVTEKQSGAPMPFVTISLLSQDSTLLQGAITDNDGSFSLAVADDSYILQASYIGYATICSDITAPLSESLLIELSEETEQLKEVEVKAKRPLIERQMDKIVMNVSQSPLAAGSNGKEILKRAPGVLIDKDGNVTVNGKGVEVYIDGRPSYLSGEQLKAMLEGTDGNTIEKIEIITNPSAKYDASGTGGIINIKTKRNMMQGLNGTLSAAYGGMYYSDYDRWINQDFVSLNLNYRTAKTYTSFNLTQVYADMAVDVNAVSETPLQKRVSHSDYNIDFQYYQLKLGNDWMIDEKNTVGFIFQAPVMVMNQQVKDGHSFGYTIQGNDTTERNIGGTKSRMLNPQHGVNLNYTHVFSDSLQRELTVNVDYNRYATNNFNSQDYIYSYADSTMLHNALDITTKQAVNVYSGKLDFQTSFWQTGMIECGGKYALSTTNNHMNTDSLLNAKLISSTPSDFNYSEHVAAMYITAGKQFGKHFSVKLGLRGEYTYSVGDWVSADSTTTKSYFNLFPTAFLSYTTDPLGKPAQPISLSASYTRRIKRPSYYQLNPFKTYVDAHNYSNGNTELTPEFNNDVELNFAYSQYLSITGTFSHTQDMQSQQTAILENGDGVMRWLNFGTCTTHGASVSLTELPIVPKFDENKNLQGAWLALTINSGYYHFINRSYELNEDGSPVYLNKNHHFNLNGSLNAYLPANWTISMDGWYSAPLTIGYNYTHANWGMSAGIRKMFPQKGLILNLQLQDMCRSACYNQEGRGLPEGHHTEFMQNITNQRLMFSVTYMFGTQQWFKQRKVGNVDEASRFGGGNGVGK